MFYDIIIIGGGIGGLYTLYQLSKKNPELKILLIEKEKKLGGRVSTYKDKYMTLEEGAGRFSDNHSLFIDLLNELGLNYKIKKTTGNVVFMPSGGRGSIMNLKDAPPTKNPSFLEALTDPVFNMVLNTVFDETSLPCTSLIAKVILESQFDSKEILQKQTFLQYASKVLQKQQVAFIWDCFGYSNELKLMNAYDCIQLMKELNPMNSFYFLKGGFSFLIDKMVEIIQKNKNICIKTYAKVKHIAHHSDSASFKIKMHKKDKGMDYEFYCKKLVCALPAQALEKFSIFKPIQKKLLDKVKPGTLCRIYSRFEKDSTGKYWFQDLPKFTTNNDLRMVIPYNKDTGTIMISYTDGAFADSWWRLNTECGIDEVEKKLKELILESTGIIMPRPKSTRIFYWKYGVGYWAVGSDSETVSKEILKPFPDMDLFICGEMYSEKYQQWMEGALETSSQIIDMIC